MKIIIYETVNNISLFMPSSDLYTAQKDAVTDAITLFCIFLVLLIDDELLEGRECTIFHIIS